MNNEKRYKKYIRKKSEVVNAITKVVYGERERERERERKKKKKQKKKTETEKEMQKYRSIRENLL